MQKLNLILKIIWCDLSWLYEKLLNLWIQKYKSIKLTFSMRIRTINFTQIKKLKSGYIEWVSFVSKYNLNIFA